MRISWVLLLVSSLLCAAESDEEALSLRRIAEFWQEGELQIAKNQMEEFIAQFPTSSYNDAICAALGDLSVKEKNFSHALNCYAQIQSPEFKEKVFLSRMQCLYEMQWYATLGEECETYLQTKKDFHVTYYLAIALYHQCLNVLKDPETLQLLAEKAKPHFEILAESDLSDEVAQAFAHICWVLKDFPKASQIYLDLARTDPDVQEEMLFQAALIQSEYNKELALQTFDRIYHMGQSKSKEAAYNKLVLAFDLGKFEEMSQIPLTELPSDRVGLAHLFLGRSLLDRKEIEPAVAELKLFIQEAPVSPTLRAALISLLDASYQCNDLDSLDLAIAKLSTLYPDDLELPKAYFSRAQVLKKLDLVAEASEQLEKLLATFPQFQQRPQALFELMHLDYQNKKWERCKQRAYLFLDQFPDHELAFFAWRYFITSSAEYSHSNAVLKEELIYDLSRFLTQPIAQADREEWEFLLAKTYFELERYPEAIEQLQAHSSANSTLLLALCYRNGSHDLPQFCNLAERAISLGTNLMEIGALHTSLFNAYLELDQIEKAAEHLFAAFVLGAEIKKENLLWLAETYFNQLQNDEANTLLATRACRVFEALAYKDEPLLCRQAKIYSSLGRIDEEISLLQTIETPSNQAQLLLAESYAKKGLLEEAASLFDSIVSNSATVRDPISASACLQTNRIKLKSSHPNLTKIAADLKTLVIQKTLLNEPIHLEAALDYVDLQAGSDINKRLTLLKKTKEEFERTDDLLSQDYHRAREQTPAKNNLYLSYMRLIDAQILATQSQLDPANQINLSDRSKDLLVQLANESTVLSLRERARMLLTNLK